jgi:hypothetical protein
VRGMFLILVAVSAVCLAGCDTSPLYDGSIPEPPTRWPNDVQTCVPVTHVFTSLKLAVTYEKYPVLPNGVAGCGYSHDETPYPEILDDDTGGGRAMGVDSGGDGVHSYEVYYYEQLSPNSKFYSDAPERNGRSNQLYNPDWTYRTPATARYPEFWIFNRPLSENEEVINGSKWRHFLFWEYRSLSSNPSAPALSVGSKDGPAAGLGLSLDPLPSVEVPQPDALILVGEGYEHAVDSGHKMLIYANYSRTVVQDAGWFAARRAMLKKLVVAVNIQPLSQDRVLEIQKEYEARRCQQFPAWCSRH